ncbi:MAG: putative lipid II flippase FtsW [Candidatus Paracaedimonas acanthamoebae]|uniref:Probable peptidoglycan glycosyltransferase FtsW n=1 Tax=Candidatus Paracaedimonas acanthamoebae TaxID=244581 RepID=A0A8J7TVT8_9PROT|nr:putative lipid II flippase FtsW [Candidatus Paracaedimonas acanthamoebae]
MTTPFARTDNSILGRWWWTVDHWLLATVSFLLGIGFFLTMAASPAVAERLHLDSFYFVKRHALYLIPVFAIIFFVSTMDIQKIRRFSFIVYAIGILFLIMTYFFGVEIKGARRWLNFGGFSIQPSEFIKPAVVVLSAWMLSEREVNSRFPGNILALGFYGFAVLLLLLQPDMGMVVLMTITMFGQFFLAGLPVLWVLIAAASSVGVLFGAYFLFPHVTQRIDRFLDRDAGDKYSDRYQITQSLEAFMNGGFLGQGPGEGTVKKHLPDAHADFIYAVAAEEFGFVLCIIILGLFAFLVLRTISRMLNENNLFIVIAVSGLIMELGIQAMINIASTLGLIPTKGMTLPFISYGGSSMLALAMGFGMVLGLTRRRLQGEG